MITPEFTLSQDDECITVVMRLPYVKISSSEFYTDAHQFSFHLKPYLLRLHFTEELLDSDEAVESNVFDHNTMKLTVRIKKKNQGEVFKDLDIIAKLLSQKPSKPTQGKAKIEVLGTTTNESEEKEEGEAGMDVPGKDEIDCNPFAIGFQRNFTDFFKNHKEELLELAEIDPSLCPIQDREQAIHTAESRKFDPDHYLSNFFESAEISQLIKKPLELRVKGKATAPSQTLTNISDIADQKCIDYLLKVGNREQLLTAEEKQRGISMLVQAVFAYLYDWRAMDFDFSSESAWTVAKLCPFIAGFVYMTDLTDTMRALYRRTLCYPIHRHYEFTKKIHRDLVEVLSLPRAHTLNILLQIALLFSHSDPRYMLNILYIDDLIVFLQSLSQEELAGLAAQIKKVEISKGSLGFMLEEFENEGDVLEPD